MGDCRFRVVQRTVTIQAKVKWAQFIANRTEGPPQTQRPKMQTLKRNFATRKPHFKTTLSSGQGLEVCSFDPEFLFLVPDMILGWYDGLRMFVTHWAL